VWHFLSLKLTLLAHCALELAHSSTELVLHSFQWLRMDLEAHFKELGSLFCPFQFSPSPSCEFSVQWCLSDSA